MPRLAVRSVSVWVVLAGWSGVANGLAMISDRWAENRAILWARNGGVWLEAHLSLTGISPVETETDLWLVPGLAVRTMSMWIFAAIGKTVAQSLASFSLDASQSDG